MEKVGDVQDVSASLHDDMGCYDPNGFAAWNVNLYLNPK